MITDDELIAPLRESLAPLHMRTPVESVIQTGRARRRRRQAFVAGAVTATTVTAVVIGTQVTGSGNALKNPAAQPQPVTTSPPVVNAHPVAFTVTSAADGTTTLKIDKGHYIDPDALRQAFAEHGIASLVTVGEFCRTRPEPALVGSILLPQDHPDGYTFTINPAAIPPGAKLSVGYFGNAVRFGAIADGAPLVCTNGTQPAAHNTTASGKAR